MLKLEKLSCYFESFDTNFNLDITKKGVVGVVGRSGSGKSTLLNLIAGFIKPQSGKIIYKSLILNNLEPAQRDLSILFQSFNNFDHLTIFENVILGIDPQMKKTFTNLKIVRDILKKLSIKFGSNKIVFDGKLHQSYDETKTAEYMKNDNIDLDIEIFTGNKSFTIYTMDFTKKYIDIKF